jgi:methyltransferase-like protein
MVRQTDAYLAHELFEDNNLPVTFTEFMQCAGRHALGYLGEAQLEANIPESMGQERGRLIRELGGGELHAAEQYTDIVTGRTFRQSLLIHAARSAVADRSLPIERVDGLHFIAPLGLKITPSTEPDQWSIDAGEGRVFDTGDAVSAEVLQRLAARLPSTSTLDDIAPTAIADEAERTRTRGTLMQLLCRGVLEATSKPVRCAPALPDRPKVWPLAASDAAAGMEFTATLRHAPYAISPKARILMPLADGTRDHKTLVECLSNFVIGEGVQISENGVPIKDPRRLREICSETVNQQLDAFARAGLFAVT